MRTIVLLSAAMLLAAAYIVSPYIAIHRIESAIERHDTVALEGYADWPALREQLRADFKSLTTDLLKADDSAVSRFAEGIAALLAPTMVDRFVDSNVSPSGVLKLIERRSETQQERRGFETSGYFTGPFDFRVDLRNLDQPDGPTVTALMEFNVHGWRVTRSSCHFTSRRSLLRRRRRRFYQSQQLHPMKG